MRETLVSDCIRETQVDFHLLNNEYHKYSVIFDKYALITTNKTSLKAAFLLNPIKMKRFS